MNDGLTQGEREAIRVLQTRQAILARRLDTELVRTLLHEEVMKIYAAGRARLRVAS